MSGSHALDVWVPGGDCPLRRDRPVTCAAFVALREWLGVSQKRFCGFFELGPATWSAIRRAAGEPDFPGRPPLVGAPYALVARWVAHRDQVWLPPLLRPEPALLRAALRRVLGRDAPGQGTLALALGRDAGAAGAWLRDTGTGAGPHAIVAVAAALLFCGPESLLAGRWRAWWAMARREAALRGIASLARTGSWQVGGRLVVPPGRWGARRRADDPRGACGARQERRRA